MRKDLIVPDEKDEMFAKPPEDIQSRVVTEPFTPLKDRIEKEHPEMLPALLQLEESMGQEDFEKYINTLQNIRRNETTVMLITSKPLHKTNLEAKFLGQIEKAFAVQFVRIVCLG